MQYKMAKRSADAESFADVMSERSVRARVPTTVTYIYNESPTRRRYFIPPNYNPDREQLTVIQSIHTTLETILRDQPQEMNREKMFWEQQKIQAGTQLWNLITDLNVKDQSITSEKQIAEFAQRKKEIRALREVYEHKIHEAEQHLKNFPFKTDWSSSIGRMSAFRMIQNIHDQANLFWFLNVESGNEILSYPYDAAETSVVLDAEQSVIGVDNTIRVRTMRILEEICGIARPFLFEEFHIALALMDAYFSQCRRVPQTDFWDGMAVLACFLMACETTKCRDKRANILTILMHPAFQMVRAWMVQSRPELSFHKYMSDDGLTEFVIVHQFTEDLTTIPLDAYQIYQEMRQQIQWTLQNAFVDVPVQRRRATAERVETDSATIRFGIRMDAIVTPLDFLRPIQRLMDLGPDAQPPLFPSWPSTTRKSISHLSDYYATECRRNSGMLAVDFMHAAYACFYLAMLVGEQSTTTDGTEAHVARIQGVWNQYLARYLAMSFSNPSFVAAIRAVHLCLQTRYQNANRLLTRTGQTYASEPMLAVARRPLPTRILHAE